MKSLIIIAIIIIASLIVTRSALYIVDVTEQVLILRFGEVRDTRTNPGLYLKAPFIDTIITFDKRILRIDAPPVAMPDKEKQNLVIDSYARYRIVDPVQFRKTLQTETGARSRLGDIVTSTLRDRVALRDRFEIKRLEKIFNKRFMITFLMARIFFNSSICAITFFKYSGFRYDGESVLLGLRLITLGFFFDY